MSAPHIPVLRHGVEYESLDQSELRGIGSDEVLARISQSNAGMIKRDLRRAEDAAAKLRALSSARRTAGRSAIVAPGAGACPPGEGRGMQPAARAKTPREEWASRRAAAADVEARRRRRAR